MESGKMEGKKGKRGKRGKRGRGERGERGEGRLFAKRPGKGKIT